MYRDAALTVNPGLPPGVSDADLDGGRLYRSTGLDERDDDRATVLSGPRLTDAEFDVLMERTRAFLRKGRAS